MWSGKTMATRVEGWHGWTITGSVYLQEHPFWLSEPNILQFVCIFQSHNWWVPSLSGTLQKFRECIFWCMMHLIWSALFMLLITNLIYIYRQINDFLNGYFWFSRLGRVLRNWNICSLLFKNYTINYRCFYLWNCLFEEKKIILFEDPATSF